MIVGENCSCSRTAVDVDVEAPKVERATVGGEGSKGGGTMLGREAGTLSKLDGEGVVFSGELPPEEGGVGGESESRVLYAAKREDG